MKDLERALRRRNRTIQQLKQGIASEGAARKSAEVRLLNLQRDVDADREKRRALETRIAELEKPWNDSILCPVCAGTGKIGAPIGKILRPKLLP